jgi:uncharacterized repeat protein (TIGR01451 family)
VPPDTEFTALVECWFPTNPTPGVGTPDRTETVTFSADQPGVVSNLPLNTQDPTQCRVTETNANGASVTVDPSGLFPVDTDLVTVTVTNTFQTGQLTVEKDVVDPSGLVATGTQYTVNVECTFAGDDLTGYPQDVVLTYDTDLSATLTGLPYGTQCTLTEPDLNGAGGVTFEPGGGTSATVTIDGSTPDVTVTVANDYPVGTFPITKSVIGPGASFVPPGTQFEVTVACTVPTDFPGTNPAPYVLTITAGQTVTMPPAPSPGLPVGTSCTIAETDSAGAGSWVAVPNSVTIAEGDQNVEVTVTNVYPTGSFTVAKRVDGPGRTFIPAGTSFTVEVRCTYPAGHPAGSGPIDGFNPLLVELESSTLGRPGPQATVGPLPVGAECTVDEPDAQGAADVTFEPDPPGNVVIVPGGQDPAVDVVVANTYPVGYGEIVKVVTGDLALALAPPGTVFLVDVTCEFPLAFPVSGPIPGFNPREVAIESGLPGEPGIVVGFGPLPVGSTCTIVETETQGADPVQIDPPGGTDTGEITITDDPDPVLVTVTNTFNPAALVIRKEITGPGAPLLPTGTEFTARVVCTFEGQTTFDEELQFSVDNPGEVTGQPVGASCTVTETQTNGAPPPPPQTVVLDPPPDPVLKEITFVNEIPAGELVVFKEIAGEAAGVIPDGIEFKVAVNCSYQGTPLPGYPVDLTFTTPDQLSETLTGLPVGAECFVNESDNGGATSVEFVPAAGPNEPAGQSGSVTIGPAGQDPVEVTVRNIFDPAVLLINKEVGPDGVLLPPGLSFTAFVECTFEGESIYSGDVEFGPGSPGLVSGLIVGASCTVTEPESQGATFDPPTQTVPIEGDGDPLIVEVTITNTFDTGSLTLEKAIDDGGTGLVPLDTEYVFDVECSFTGLPLPGYPTTVTVTPQGGPVDLPGLLPVGTQCTIVERDLKGADSVTYVPGDTVEITAEAADVAVVATNTYPVGEFTVTKVVAGPGATAVPPDTTFTVEVSCTFPAGFPVQGGIPGFSPKELTLTPGQSAMVGPLPFGAVCTTTETGTGGAREVAVRPEQVTVGDGDAPVLVTVTNTFPAPPSPPTVAGETCDPDDPLVQVPGSITIPANPDFAYAIDGVPYSAGTYPFPAGTYTVTATRAPAPGAGVQQLALESFSWTVAVPGSEVCPGLTKQADPPSGDTVVTSQIVAYTITVENGGDEPVVGETLVDQLPDGADLIESSVDPASGVYDAGANTLTWTFDLPAAGGSPSSATFSYEVRVTADSGTLVNSVTWVERNLTGTTEHPTVPGTTEGITDKPPPGGLTDTGAGQALSLGVAAVVAMLLGGLMVGFGRRRGRLT